MSEADDNGNVQEFARDGVELHATVEADVRKFIFSTSRRVVTQFC